MSNSSNYRVGPPPTPSASPATAIGGLLLFAGLFLLLMGFSEYYGGSTTRDMYRGTVLEGNADVNRIMTNTMDGGAAKMGFGILARSRGRRHRGCGPDCRPRRRTTTPLDWWPIVRAPRRLPELRLIQCCWARLQRATLVIF